MIPEDQKHITTQWCYTSDSILDRRRDSDYETWTKLNTVMFGTSQLVLLTPPFTYKLASLLEKPWI